MYVALSHGQQLAKVPPYVRHKACVEEVEGIFQESFFTNIL